MTQIGCTFRELNPRGSYNEIVFLTDLSLICTRLMSCIRSTVHFVVLSSGDPHMTGFLGQKFDFTGEDGAWYCLIADENININMRVTSPVVDLPEITYITGRIFRLHRAHQFTCCC